MSEKAPVAIFGFNRPDCLKLVFERVRESKPDVLFLVLDAPRMNRPDDAQKWMACKAIFEKVDWECRVYRNYAEKNMGCRERMATGISWVFEHVERAILLEDDCVPHLDFFAFCAALLERYAQDSRVGMIAGHDEHFERVETYGASYYFDRLGTIWGWATWRRAWSRNKPDMDDWEEIKRTDVLLHLYGKRRYVRDWIKIFERVYHRRVSSWATAWALTMAREHWLCIHPAHNLITNVGFGSDATHTATGATTPWANRCTYPMAFPLVHPTTMIPNVRSEWIAQDTQYSIPLVPRAVIIARNLLKRLFVSPKRVR